MMGTLAAARTKRLRIGTAVSLAPFYHPLRLAEEVALLDVLSGGRVNWGAGRGFARVEFKAFGVPPEESASRFREAVEIVLRAWTEERLSFQGKHFRFDDVEVLPKPLQQPHPPVWMAATSEPAIDWAAGRGFSILMDPHASMTDLGRQAAALRRAPAAAGFSDARPRHADGAADGAAPTTAEAEAVARRGAAMAGRLLCRAAASDGDAGDAQLRRRTRSQHYVDDVILHGTPNSVVDQIARLQGGDRPQLPAVRAAQPADLHPADGQGAAAPVIVRVAA